ncbi:kelch-like protein diablo [Diaphorina citri]|uniref:Kelch-like protein diablo n=1 Tax=Diaphorina citri TaxID=121845 RepID=A0A3Q0JQL2_DIACI|nr:kelch-like protein diablo [Diaphorina citri]
MAPMSTRRKHLGCAVFNNVIYAVGGRDDSMELSSAEKYNPHTNTWLPIVAMTSRRSGVSSTFSVCHHLHLTYNFPGLEVGTYLLKTGLEFRPKTSKPNINLLRYVPTISPGKL